MGGKIFTSTRTILLATAAAATLLGFAVAVVPGDFEVTTHDVGSASRSKVRVVQISDLHIQNFGERESRLAQSIRDLEPDVIALTGDTIDYSASRQSLEFGDCTG
jgi:predicted MPP superfamily phosphohydrolase